MNDLFDTRTIIIKQQHQQVTRNRQIGGRKIHAEV